jgi:hypothetical protein
LILRPGTICEAVNFGDAAGLRGCVAFVMVASVGVQN